MKRALVLLALVGCGGDDGGGGGGDGGTGGSSAHEFCVSETNRYRQIKGKPALARSAQLEAYADEGAQIDFSSTPHDHFTQTNGGGIAFAENECPGQFGWMVTAGESESDVVGRCIKAFYDEGPGGGHYENMMGAYTKVGCGIYQAGGKITIVQDLGN
jgi:hypothetical protein